MDDVRFRIEDLYFNPEFGAIPAWLLSKDQAKTPVVFEVVDDWTFRLTFAAPYGSLIKYLALSAGTAGTHSCCPSTTCSSGTQVLRDAGGGAGRCQPHCRGVAYAIRPEAVRHFDNGYGAEKCVGHPVLSPWMMTEVTAEAAAWERNPYYFKVDWAGRQLPYMDRWISVVSADIETANLLALNVSSMPTGSSICSRPPWRWEWQGEGLRPGTESVPAR